MRRVVGVMVFAVAGAGLLAPPVWAQDGVGFDIPLDTVVRGDEGSVHLLATEPVAGEDVGRDCDVVVEGANNTSVHPNTDLLVRSGGSEVEVLDVERAPDARTEATGTIVLDTEVSVSVRLGPDGVFSGGLIMTLDCPTPPSTTTTTTGPPTTTPPPEPPAPPAPPAQPVAGHPSFVG
jgi:hypothetical protein